MTNNGLKISEMVYSNIEDAVNNNAQVPVSVEIGGVKGNRRVPIQLITDRYVEKDPASQDPQLINSPVTIAPDAALDYNNPALLVKGIEHVSNTGSRTTETVWAQTTTSNTEAQTILSAGANGINSSSIRDIVVEAGNPRASDYTVVTAVGKTASHSDAVEPVNNGLQVVRLSSVRDNDSPYEEAREYTVVENDNFGLTVHRESYVDNGPTRVSTSETMNTTWYNKIVDFHDGVKKLEINTGSEDIKITGFDVELDDKGIKDNAGSKGTSGQVLSSTGTGVAWTDQSSGGGTSIATTGNSIQTFVYAGASLFNSYTSETISGPTKYGYNTAIAVNADFYNDVTGQSSTIGNYPFNLVTFDDPAISGNTITIDEGYDYYITLDKVTFRYDGLYASDTAPVIQLTTPITIVFRYKESKGNGTMITPDTDGSVDPYLYFQSVTTGYYYEKDITGNTYISTPIAYTTSDVDDVSGTGVIDVYAKYNYTTKKLLIMFDKIPSCRTYIKTPKVVGAFGIGNNVTLDDGTVVLANTSFGIYGWPTYYPAPIIGSHYNMWYGTQTPSTASPSINVPTYKGYSSSLGPSGAYVFEATNFNGASDNNVYIMNVHQLPHVMCKADITLIKTNAT